MFNEGAWRYSWCLPDGELAVSSWTPLLSDAPALNGASGGGLELSDIHIATAAQGPSSSCAGGGGCTGKGKRTAKNGSGEASKKSLSTLGALGLWSRASSPGSTEKYAFEACPADEIAWISLEKAAAALYN